MKGRGFPVLLKQIRIQLGVTQREFGDIVGIQSPCIVSCWERGLNEPCRERTERIMRIYNQHRKLMAIGRGWGPEQMRAFDRKYELTHQRLKRAVKAEPNEANVCKLCDKQLAWAGGLACHMTIKHSVMAAKHRARMRVCGETVGRFQQRRFA